MKKVLFLITTILFISCKDKTEMVIVTAPAHNHQAKAVKSESPLNNLEYASNLDLYCRMDITKHGVSDTLSYKGKLYGFCATMCKEQFAKQPEYFLAKDAAKNNE